MTNLEKLRSLNLAEPNYKLYAWLSSFEDYTGSPVYTDMEKLDAFLNKEYSDDYEECYQIDRKRIVNVLGKLESEKIVAVSEDLLSSYDYEDGLNYAIDLLRDLLG